MLVIGGWGDTGRNTGWGNSTVKACSEFLQILDLSTLKLISDFSDEPYEVPSVVTKVIGGKYVYILWLIRRYN